MLTKLPILELGAGEFSTRILRGLFPDREIISLENSKKWYDHLKNTLEDTDKHKLQWIPDWSHVLKFMTCEWGVVFVDTDPISSRVELMDLFKSTSNIVVLHDSEAVLFEQGKKLFRSGIEFRTMSPWTFIGSNHYTCDRLLTGLPTL